MIDVSKIKPGDRVKVKVWLGEGCPPPSTIEGEVWCHATRSLYVGTRRIRWGDGRPVNNNTILEHTPVWSPPEGWQDWDGVMFVDHQGRRVILLNEGEGWWRRVSDGTPQPVRAESIIQAWREKDDGWREVKIITDPEKCGGCGGYVAQAYVCPACEALHRG